MERTTHNLHMSQVLGRKLRVDHKLNYKPPKQKDEEGEVVEEDEAERLARANRPGHAYEGQEMANEFNVQQGIDIYAPVKLSKEGKPTLYWVGLFSFLAHNP